MIVLAKLSDWLIGSISTNGKLNQTNSTSCKRKFSCPLSMFQVISRNSEWFIAMFALVAIGRNSYYVVEFSIVFWKALWNLKSVNVDRHGKLNKKIRTQSCKYLPPVFYARNALPIEFAVDSCLLPKFCCVHLDLHVLTVNKRQKMAEVFRQNARKRQQSNFHERSPCDPSSSRVIFCHKLSRLFVCHTSRYIYFSKTAFIFFLIFKLL